MRYLKIISFILSSFLFSAVQANTQTLWQTASAAKSTNPTSSGQLYQLDESQLRDLLSLAPLEGDGSSRRAEIFLPVSSGSIERFTLLESPIMQSGLAARYPEIKTYKVYGIDDPLKSGRLSISPVGFHGMITSPTGSFYIDPQGSGHYQAYSKRDLGSSPAYSCGVEGHTQHSPVGRGFGRGFALRTAGSLREYRIAVATTAEYGNAAGSNVMTYVTNTINRVNVIYERDLAVKLVLVSNTNLLFYDGSVGSDPYTNSDAFAMLTENQNNIDVVIGNGNYDIGHVFGIGGGGVARLGAVCGSGAKARGVSTGFSRSLDTKGFAIDLVAHEIGHQFNASHSFNGTTSNCINRSGLSAVEPGSGSSIMAYSGICREENIQFSADAMFHAHSIDVIDKFTTDGRGSSCGTLVAINNPNEPVADAGDDYTIPISTPFVLTADGSDADGDTLTYTWGQMDRGTATSAGTLGTDLGDNALMRTYLPRSTRSRYFPNLETVIGGGSNKAETLPTRDRTLTFKVNVRDGKSGLGKDTVIITAENNAGPFTVTSHNSNVSLSGGDSQNITWNVANTDQAPVSCANVDIDLLLFNNSKNNYCVESLASATPNVGSTTITLPNLSANKARFRVSCSDNVFYALSQGDLQLAGASNSPTNCYSVGDETEEQGEPPTNTPPILSINTPADGSNFALGQTINFAATANDTQDGVISHRIVWSSHIDGSLGTGASLNVNSLSTNTHTITASVADDDNAIVTRTITLTVSAAPPPPPLSNDVPVVTITGPADGSNFSQGDNINLTGIADDTEDLNISQDIEWSSNLDGPLGNGAALMVNNLSVGNHTITASVTDSGNATGMDSLFLSVISPTNVAPTLSISGPADKSSFEPGENITFTGKANDTEDGDISSAITWSSDLDGLLGNGSRIDVDTLSEGVHSVTALIADSGNAKAASTITITVSANSTGGGSSGGDDDDGGGSGGGLFDVPTLLMLLVTGVFGRLYKKQVRVSRRQRLSESSFFMN